MRMFTKAFAQPHGKVLHCHFVIGDKKLRLLFFTRKISCLFENFDDMESCELYLPLAFSAPHPNVSEVQP